MPAIHSLYRRALGFGVSHSFRYGSYPAVPNGVITRVDSGRVGRYSTIAANSGYTVLFVYAFRRLK